MEPSEMNEAELSFALRRSADALDKWKEHGLPKTPEELGEHFDQFMTWHLLAKEFFKREIFRNAKKGRKPWEDQG